MTTTPPDMSAALDRMWAKFLPEMQERVAAIEEAVQALSEGRLLEAQREAAHGAAHKLAGSLGVFGRARGTEVARAIEHALVPNGVPSAPEITELAAELRKIIESPR